MKSADTELAGYVLCDMMTARDARSFARGLGLRVPAGARKKSARKLASQVTYAQVHNYCVDHWERPRVDVHLANLKSGKLLGHSWHETRPSILHMGFQAQVRRVASGDITLDEFLDIGSDITKKEYVMVAVSDLTEHCFIEKCGATPPLKHKSLSDVVINGLPYDIKNLSEPAGWTVAAIRAKPKEFATAMVRGADPERDRVQAAKAFNHWSYNRLYVVVGDETRWTREPERVLDELSAAVLSIGAPLSLKVNSVKFAAHVIAL